MKNLQIKPILGTILFLLGFSISSYGQEAMMLVKIEGKKISTIVTFTGIPEGVRATWTQDITDAPFMRVEQPFNYPHWDTNKNMLTLTIDNYPKIHHCSFIIACEYRKKPNETIVWGKAMMSYETPEKETKTIIFYPRAFTLAELKKQNNAIIIKADPDATVADVFPFKALPGTGGMASQQKQSNKSKTEVVRKVEEPVQTTPQQPVVEQPVVVENPPTQKVEPVQKPQEPVVTQKPVQQSVRTTVEPIRQQQIISPYQGENLGVGKFYIQFSAQSQPRNLALVKAQVKLLPRDKMEQRKVGDMYKCVIGPYETMEEAIDNLTYYRQFFQRLFVAQYDFEGTAK